MELIVVIAIITFLTFHIFRRFRMPVYRLLSNPRTEVQQEVVDGPTDDTPVMTELDLKSYVSVVEGCNKVMFVEARVTEEEVDVYGIKFFENVVHDGVIISADSILNSRESLKESFPHEKAEEKDEVYQRVFKEVVKDMKTHIADIEKNLV